MVQLLTAGLRGRAHNIRWTKAHPERAKSDPGTFTSEERSIFAADLLAGGRRAEFLAFTGLADSDIRLTTDVRILQQCARLAPIMVSDAAGRPLTTTVRERDRRQWLTTYMKGRLRPQFAHGTPAFAAAIRQPAKTAKLSYNGQRSRAQWVRITWDKHFSGAAALRYGTQGCDGVCKCCPSGEVESQDHIIQRCTGGSMEVLRSSAIRNMAAVVVNLVREHHPHAQLLLEIQDIILSADGAQLWTGMLTPAIRARLELITQFVPQGDQTAQLNALIHNMCRPLATGASDLYTERSRLLRHLASPMAAPSTPTVPTDYLAIRRLAAAAQKRRAKAQRDSRLAKKACNRSEQGSGSAHAVPPCDSHSDLSVNANAAITHDNNTIHDTHDTHDSNVPNLHASTVSDLHVSSLPASVSVSASARHHAARAKTKDKARRTGSATTGATQAGRLRRLTHARNAISIQGTKRIDSYFSDAQLGTQSSASRSGIG